MTPDAASDAASEARNRAAAGMRRLGHAIVGHDAEVALLDRIAEIADATAATVEQGRPRSRQIETIKWRLWEEPPGDGLDMSHFPECVVSGAANPLGIGMSVRRDGQEAVATVNLGNAFEGAPKRAHGGVVAAICDDVMGYVLVLHRTPAFTGRLTIHYRAPVPVGSDLVVRAQLRERNGRKLHMAAQIHQGDVLLCDAEGLFIAIPPERLGLSPDEMARIADPG